MQGLQIVFGWSNVSTRTENTGTVTSQNVSTRSQALPQAGVTYSLYIANASDLRSDVLARPSLVVLDRQPSQFRAGDFREDDWRSGHSLERLLRETTRAIYF